jgi:hypothetical protein
MLGRCFEVFGSMDLIALSTTREEHGFSKPAQVMGEGTGGCKYEY